MSWLEHHARSEAYAGQAEQLDKQHQINRAIQFYRLAAEAEINALETLDPSKTRTLGITAVSAASLYYKAQDFEQAKHVARKWLASQSLPPFAVDQLNDLWQMIHTEESCVTHGTDQGNLAQEDPNPQTACSGRSTQDHRFSIASPKLESPDPQDP